MTSRDLTDNVEQYQILRSLQQMQVKYAALLLRLGQRALQWKDLAVAGRTHYAAAQPTTLGKRLAMFGEEMLGAFDRLNELVQRYPLRGLKGRGRHSRRPTDPARRRRRQARSTPKPRAAPPRLPTGTRGRRPDLSPQPRL